MGFALFILVNVTLFIRPAEIFPDTEGWPIYLVLILTCLVVSGERVSQKLAGLQEQPITLCVLGLWLVAVLSHLTKLDIYSAREVGFAFGKVVIYFLLLISLVDSPGRLRIFLAWVLVAITTMVVLAVLQYHGWVELAGLKVMEEVDIDKETGEQITIPRLCGSGMFNDPNDLCLALTMGVVLSLYWLREKRVGPVRILCLPALALFGYALRLTQSRGGLLGLFVALLALSWSRFGWRKTILPALVLVPGTLFLMGGRQAEFTLRAGGTGQERIQLWAEGLALFKQAPLFGIGAGNYADEIGQVAHNSFIHAFVEMGFVGGTFFVGAFYLALSPLAGLSRRRGEIADEELQHLQPFIFSLVAAYAGGVWSLSRNYIEVTYLILGIAQIYLGMLVTRVRLLGWREGVIKRIGWVGAVALSGFYIVTRSTAIWG